ncbi:MAG TPA: hypothetical protein VMR52_09310 [Dehalococcoidia bacterium]|nr:hypothetical protein [Dehalococcoidia bacterium]
MRILLFSPIALVLAITTLLTLSPNGSAHAETIVIETGNNWFCTSDFQTQPCVTNLTAGDTVNWTIVEGVHTVAECDTGHVNCGNGFDSGILETDQSFTQTFNTPGSVSYYCAIHPDMTGILNVQEPTPAPTPAPGTAVPAGNTVAPASTTQSPGSVPATGGPPSEGSAVSVWLIALVTGGLLAIGGGSVVAASRR